MVVNHPTPPDLGSGTDRPKESCWAGSTKAVAEPQLLHLPSPTRPFHGTQASHGTWFANHVGAERTQTEGHELGLCPNFTPDLGQVSKALQPELSPLQWTHQVPWQLHSNLSLHKSVWEELGAGKKSSVWWWREERGTEPGVPTKAVGGGAAEWLPPHPPEKG